MTLERLIDAMRDAGIVPVDPAEVQLTGRVVRFRVGGDKPGRRDGWVIGHDDDKPAARFGHWVSGAVHSWSSGQSGAPDPIERARWQRLADERERARECEAKQARNRAYQIWRTAKPCPADYPYLTTKQVGPGIARLHDGVMVLPIFDTSRELHSLQFIRPDGSKRFLRGGRIGGCFIPVCGRLSGARLIYITEGWATGQSVAMVRPHAFTVAALSAGNLTPAAKAIKAASEAARIVVCADANEVGRAEGKRAAIAVSGRLAVPDIPPGCDGDDFNDLMRYKHAGDKRHNTNTR